MTESIFISYAPQDLAFVKQLHQTLNNKGLSCWFDEDVENKNENHHQEIKQRIKACQVFLMVLSPAVTAFNPFIDQFRYADGEAKKIIMLEWQTTNLLTPKTSAMLSYKPDSINFGGDASTANFDKLIHTLQPLIKNVIPSHAFDKANITKNTTTPPQTNHSAKAKKSVAEEVSPLAFYASVISNVIAPLGLDFDYEEIVREELKWLFAAVANLLAVERSEADRNNPVSVSIPVDAELLDKTVNNCLLAEPEELLLFYDTYEEFLEEQARTLRSKLRIGYNTQLQDLDKLITREAEKGEAGQGDPQLQRQIKTIRLSIIKEVIQEIATEINKAYGILVNSFAELEDYLQAYVPPLAIGALVIANVITPLDLDADDTDYINHEVKWLFNAINTYQQVYRSIQAKLLAKSKALKATSTLSSQTLNNYLNEIYQAEIEASKPLSTPIPEDAELLSEEANNNLLSIVDNNELDYYVNITAKIVTARKEIGTNLNDVNLIKIELDNLVTLIERESGMGEAAQRDIELQNKIKNTRKTIINHLQNLADIMADAYDVQLTEFERLLEQLED